ncbi:MAG TPA: hypothetical protein VGF84_20410 [Micromonosporaceae bacterium]
MNAWVAALIMMAFAEVLARLVTMRLRAHRLPQPAPAMAARPELVNA